MTKNKVIMVQDKPIIVVNVNEQDYISLTDMVKKSENGSALIDNWLRNKNTVEFIGIWEKMNNPDFNSLEFEEIKKEAGLNRFTISVKKWADKTNAIPPVISPQQEGYIYASEADLLNVALFGKTAAEWRKENPGKSGNIRDEATLEQLVVLTNLESINAVFLRQELSQSERLKKLNEIAISQMQSLISNKSLKKLN